MRNRCTTLWAFGCVRAAAEVITALGAGVLGQLKPALPYPNAITHPRQGDQKQPVIRKGYDKLLVLRRLGMAVVIIQDRFSKHLPVWLIQGVEDPFPSFGMDRNAMRLGADKYDAPTAHSNPTMISVRNYIQVVITSCNHWNRCGPKQTDQDQWPVRHGASPHANAFGFRGFTGRHAHMLPRGWDRAANTRNERESNHAHLRLLASICGTKKAGAHRPRSSN